MSIGQYGPGSGPPGSASDPWLQIKLRPTVALPASVLAASARLTTRPGIVTGWHLRDASGSAGGETALVDVDNSAVGVAAAIVATLPAAAGKTTYLTGFEVTGWGATAPSTIAVTVTGVLGGTKTYALAIPAGTQQSIVPLEIEFSRPLPASAPNTAIAVNVPTFGAGNLGSAVTAHGYQGGPPGSSLAAFIADLFDGGDATGQAIGSISINPDGADVCDIGSDGPYFRNGLFINVLQGAAQGAIWVKI